MRERSKRLRLCARWECGYVDYVRQGENLLEALLFVAVFSQKKKNYFQERAGARLWLAGKVPSLIGRWRW
jgi:hypothetical protein